MNAATDDDEKTKSTAGALPCIAYVVAYHAVTIGFLVAWHARAHGVVNPTHALIAIFLVINAWICVCEIALLTYPTHIKREFGGFVAKYGAHTLPPVFLFQPVLLRDVFSLRYWSVMWSTYSTLDPAYIDTHSFGFCIDVGNGVTMLGPSILFAYGMTAQGAFLSPRALGMLGLIAFYQMFYGTAIYFFQFFFNRRQDVLSKALVGGVVIPANFIWSIFPALGMWACSRLIVDGDFGVFL